MLLCDEAGGLRCSKGGFCVPLWGREGGREGDFYLAVVRQTQVVVCLYLCWFDNLCYCFYVISFILLYQNPEMTGQKQGVLWRYDMFPE